jgi:hypothetical protein
MKHLFLAALCFIALNTKAQSIDTVKSAILIQPVVVNVMAKDTAYQVTWSAFGVTPDTAQGCNTYVQMFDRKGKKVLDFNCPIPAATKNAWGPDDVITNFIFLTYGITRKQ